MDFGIKIERQKAKIVARKIIFMAWIAKTDYDLHDIDFNT
jgi:hypothetical protein